ncbi:SDR family oxidoreductase [soil metagenome]
MSGRTDADDVWRKRYGPWAVVTGASDGIGEAIARDLAARGLHLVLVARRANRLQHVADACRQQFGVDVRVLPVDLAARPAVRSLLDATADIDVGLLVAAAGFGTSGRFLDLDEVDELGMVEVNCHAVLAMTKAFAARLAARGHGGIVLFSSLLAFQGVPKSANYAATKAYIQTLAEGLHAELKTVGVDVLSCAPGPVKTGFATRSNMQMGMATTPEIVARDTLAALGTASTVRPGLLSKVLIWSLATLPRKARTAIMGAIMAGMTKHQDEAQAAAEV